jgi:hypothetical protein
MAPSSHRETTPPVSVSLARFDPRYTARDLAGILESVAGEVLRCRVRPPAGRRRTPSRTSTLSSPTPQPRIRTPPSPPYERVPPHAFVCFAHPDAARRRKPPHRSASLARASRQATSTRRTNSSLPGASRTTTPTPARSTSSLTRPTRLAACLRWSPTCAPRTPSSYCKSLLMDPYFISAPPSRYVSHACPRLSELHFKLAMLPYHHASFKSPDKKIVHLLSCFHHT